MHGGSQFSVMSESDQTRLRLIQEYPILSGLDAFRTLFRSKTTNNGIDQLRREDLKAITFSLLSALRFLPVSVLLQSKASVRHTIRDDILRLISTATSDDFDFNRIEPLLKAALTDNPEDVLIWDHVANAALESKSPPRPIYSKHWRRHRPVRNTQLLDRGDLECPC